MAALLTSLWGKTKKKKTLIHTYMNTIIYWDRRWSSHVKCDHHLLHVPHSFAPLWRKTWSFASLQGTSLLGLVWATLLMLVWLLIIFNIALLILQQIWFGCSLEKKKKNYNDRPIRKKLMSFFFFLYYTSRGRGRLSSNVIRQELNWDCCFAVLSIYML